MDNNNDLFGDSFRDFHDGLSDFNRYVDVPVVTDMLQDGREVIRIGYVDEFKAYNHLQGQTEYGDLFKGTCGLVACEDILQQFQVPGIQFADGTVREVSEATLILYGVANDLCHVGFNPGENGATTSFSQIEILRKNGVPAHFEMANDAETLATNIEQGRGVILSVNAGVMWNDATAYGTGDRNHAVVCTGIARDPATGSMMGVYINDSGRGYPSDSGRFVPMDVLDAAWLDTGGSMVVTDLVV
ncbi:hypothetical protein GCM10027347_55720 [Larkinella harenae]